MSKRTVSITAEKVTLASDVGLSSSSRNQVLGLLPVSHKLPETKVCHRVKVPKEYSRTHKWYWIDDESASLLALAGVEVTLIVEKKQNGKDNIIFSPGTPKKYKLVPVGKKESNAHYTGGDVVYTTTPNKETGQNRTKMGVVLVPNGSTTQVKFPDEDPFWFATNSLGLVKCSVDDGELSPVSRKLFAEASNSEPRPSSSNSEDHPNRATSSSYPTKSTDSLASSSSSTVAISDSEDLADQETVDSTSLTQLREEMSELREELVMVKSLLQQLVLSLESFKSK